MTDSDLCGGKPFFFDMDDAPINARLALPLENGCVVSASCIFWRDVLEVAIIQPDGELHYSADGRLVEWRGVEGLLAAIEYANKTWSKNND